MSPEAHYLARVAYAAYAASSASARTFADLTPTDQQAWDAAADAVCVAVIRAISPYKESAC